ncbi:hypothetical protein NZD89_17420 [Alicyclobacillus fastidiosus]|uniref:Uncharacterized protein n=1 Tax=Alicyclobacillus fastidiosus TaxID=392011 RepID=A0ABY6ZB90_9BACL|nr:hypothetical protein [Alicyclobacillus fastidiosus]WAH40155.1 hypothetical protein NZD89_17420 [Alicyclobacillus fastidiosus]
MKPGMISCPGGTMECAGRGAEVRAGHAKRANRRLTLKALDYLTR